MSEKTILVRDHSWVSEAAEKILMRNSIDHSSLFSDSYDKQTPYVIDKSGTYRGIREIKTYARTHSTGR